MNKGDDELTYAAAGVDVEASDVATAAIAASLGDLDTDEFAGLLDIGDRYLAMATDGVGTKLLVAHALKKYDTIGIDCVAMNVNDLVAMGINPVGFVDYLAMDTPDEEITGELGKGLAAGAEESGMALLGGELAILPEIVDGFDLAGTCVGLAPKDGLFDGTPTPGDALVGFPSSGIHSNGLTLARKAITGKYAYTDPFPGEKGSSVGEVLLEPTRIYTHLLEPFRTHRVKSVAHITGGGWRNLNRLGEWQYIIEDPWPAQPIFDLIAETGNVTPEEMHQTFNMGTGFVAVAAKEDADALSSETGGRIIGRVESGDGIEIRGLTLSA